MRMAATEDWRRRLAAHTRRIAQLRSTRQPAETPQGENAAEFSNQLGLLQSSLQRAVRPTIGEIETVPLRSAD